MNPELRAHYQSEIQRLKALRDKFRDKRDACMEEIKLQQSNAKLWEECLVEVRDSIAQVEKMQYQNPTPCRFCHCTPCMNLVGCPTPSYDEVIAQAKVCPTCKVPYTPDGGCGCTLKKLAARADEAKDPANYVSFGPCPKCGCLKGPGICHCEKPNQINVPKPSKRERCPKCQRVIGNGEPGRCADHA